MGHHEGGSRTKDIWQCGPVSACVFLHNGWRCERGRCQKVCGNLDEINTEPALPGKHVYGTQPPSDYDGVFAAGRFIVELFCWKVLEVLQQPGDIYKRCPISFQTAILCLVRAVWCFISGYLREEDVSPVLQHQMGIYCYYRGSYAGCWLSAFGICFGASFGCQGHWQVQDREGKTTGTEIGEWPQSEPWCPGRWGYQTIPNSNGEVEGPRPQGFGWSTFWNHYPSDAEDQRTRDAPFTFSQDLILFCAEGPQGDAFGPACLRQSARDTGIFQWHSQSLNIEYVSVSGALHCFALVYPCFTICKSSSRSSHYQDHCSDCAETIIVMMLLNKPPKATTTTSLFFHFSIPGLPLGCHLPVASCQGDDSYWKSIGADQGNLAEEDGAFAMSLGAKTVLYNASAFQRRIVQPLERFPLLLLKFGCGDRRVCKQLATRLLTEDSLHTTASKFRDLFRTELGELQQTGVLADDRLGSMVHGLTIFGKADVRDSERTNKSVKLQETRSPNIGHDLLSSRVCASSIILENKGKDKVYKISVGAFTKSWRKSSNKPALLDGTEKKR